MGLNHFDEDGKAVMVDVTEKSDTLRIAQAKGIIRVNCDVYEAIKRGTSAKGDVLAVAATADIMAAKKTWELIPMCHQIPIGSCKVDFEKNDERREVTCTCVVRTAGKTGAEMEALTGVTVALLTIYDMCKSMDKFMEITGVELIKKTGGKSGDVINERCINV